MPKLVVRCFSISLDGFGAGPEQSLEDPLGKGGMDLHGWVFKTRTFQAMHGAGTGAEADSVDEGFAAMGFDNLGAWVLGRNMFGPVRGPWPDETWQGWWGDEPPYHCPVYVLTHHARPDLQLSDTTFHFVTDGLEAALTRAKAAAGGKDVRLGGGVATLREAFQGGYIDEAHFAVSPVLLGRGEALFAGLDLPALGYRVTERVSGEGADHTVIGRA